MGQYVSSNTRASNPGKCKLSKVKFAKLRDEILCLKGLKKAHFTNQFNRINDYLMNGDTQPAVVVSLSPLIVSAYSDEMDAVIFLQFPEKLAELYSLEVGTRLVTSNVYHVNFKKAKDITVGSEYLKRYSDFEPLVQLFLGFDDENIRGRTYIFGDDIWQKVLQMTRERMEKDIPPRDGFATITKFKLVLA